jgi:membrane protein DedA with SNARE-associated domain
MLLVSSLVDDLLGRFGYGAVFGFVAIESLGIPLPGETMLIAASLYAGATHRLSIELIIVIAAAAAIIGDNIGFWIGHWGGYRLLVRYGKYIRLDVGRVKLARYLFRRHGGKVVFFGRFVSVLRTYAAFLAGSARMSWPPFLAFNAAGGVVWATAWGIAAYFAGDRIQRLGTPVDIALGIVAFAVVVLLVLLLRRKEHDLMEQAERAMPGPLERP